jgi:hypothetical protein
VAASVVASGAARKSIGIERLRPATGRVAHAVRTSDDDEIHIGI